MSLRILHVIPSVAACRGGPSKAVLEMVNALIKQDVRAEIATTNDSCNDVLAVELNTLVDYKGAPTRFFKRLSSPINGLREFQYSSEFKQWLQAHIHDYDVIHIHAIFSYCSTYAMWLARKRKISYIVRPIGQLENWSLQQKTLKKKLFLSLVERKNLTSANCIHFTAKSEQQQALENLPLKTSTVIPLGIDIPEIMPDASSQLRHKHQINPEQTLIATLSRLHKKKGLEILLKSLAQINSKTYKLLIAGDGDIDYLIQLKSLISQLRIERNVIWLGFIEGQEKNLLLQGADLFALTSYSENFGISVLEALAAGTPTLVSQHVALSEQIKQAELGWVTDTTEESIVTNLKAAIELLSSDNDAYRKLGQRANSYAHNNFNWTSVASRLKTMYQNAQS